MSEIIIKYINEQLLAGSEAPPLNVEDDLLENGLIDSMGMMSLIGFIEDHFGVKIPPQEMTIENFKTVKAINMYLDRQKTDG